MTTHPHSERRGSWTLVHDNLLPCREVSAVLGLSKGVLSQEQGVCRGHREGPGLTSRNKTASRKRPHLRAVMCSAVQAGRALCKEDVEQWHLGMLTEMCTCHDIRDACR